MYDVFDTNVGVPGHFVSEKNNETKEANNSAKDTEAAEVTGSENENSKEGRKMDAVQTDAWQCLAGRCLFSSIFGFLSPHYALSPLAI